MMENPKRPCSSSSVSEQSNEEDEMKIYLKVTKTVALTVKKSDTIENVKAKFRHVEGAPKNLQELYFAGNHLSDGLKLADCNIQNHSTLLMVVHGIAERIFVKMPSPRRTLALDVKPWYTIQNIKALIHKEEQVPPEQQRIIYGGKTVEDEETLASYFIMEETPTFHLIIHPRDELQVFIQTPDRKTIPLEVKTWYKVEDVMVMIESMLGYPVDTQRIIFNGQRIRSDRTLNDHNIRQGSSLCLVFGQRG